MSIAVHGWIQNIEF